MTTKLMSVSKRGFAVIAVLFFNACSHDNESISSLSADSVTEFSSLYSEQIYHILQAEYHYQQHDYKQASQAYNNLLMIRADANVAKRATELAVKVEDYDQALIAAEQWKLLEPDAAQVNHFLVLLYQEKKNYQASANVLADLVKSYPSGKAKSLDIAVALLEQQKDATHAFHTFKYYLQHNVDGRDKTTNKNAGTATYYLGLFAMKAKLFAEVISVTEAFSDKKTFSDEEAPLSNKEAAVSAKAMASKEDPAKVEIDKIEMQRKTALLRVKAFTELDQPEQGLKVLKKLIAAAADPVTKQSYARFMASLGQAKKAVALLEQVYNKHPDKAELLLDMISISLMDEEYKKTLLFVDKLEKIKGQEDTARYYRGAAFELQHKYPEALKAYTSIKTENQSIQTYTKIAMVLPEAKGLNSAISYLYKLQKNSSKNINLLGDLYLLESDVLREHGRYEQALKANKKAAKLLPMDLSVLYSQALLYEDVNQIKKSEETLHGILQIDSNHSAALNALGYMLSVHTTRFDEAYKYIKKAYDLKPNDPAILDSLGWVSYRKGDLQGAERYLRIAYQKLPDPEVAGHLVEVLSKQGQQEEATKLLHEMLLKHPDNKRLIEIKTFINK
ncbi:MAG: hypothetical protein V3U84_08460 [Thiotrichaceae bacterium]